MTGAEGERFTVAPGAQAKAARAFERWREEISRLLGPVAEAVHIGATAVSGALTKGDLDILVRVPSSAFARAEAVLAQRFDRNTGSDRHHDFAAFLDNGADPPLGIQLTAIGGRYDADFTLFRDRLMADAALLTAYNELKRSFDGKSMGEYRRAKERFIERAIRGDDDRSRDE